MTSATALAIASCPDRGSKPSTARARAPFSEKMSETRALRRSALTGSRALTTILEVRVEREPPAEAFDLFLHARRRALVIRRGQHARDQVTDLIHLCFAHAAGGDRRCTHTDTRRGHRRIA